MKRLTSKPYTIEVTQPTIIGQTLRQLQREYAWDVLFGRLYRADEGVPYGIALSAAAMTVYPQTPWMQHVFASVRVLGG